MAKKNRKYEDACYDCGSTVEGHHTPSCEMAEEGAVMDLPEIPGTQYWTGGTTAKRLAART